MPAIRIDIRDTLIELLRELPLFADLSHRVAFGKLDDVQKFPFASVYTTETDSEPSSMNGCADREMIVQLDIFLDCEGGDVEKEFSELLETLEIKVERLRKDGQLPRFFFLSKSKINHVSNSKGAAGDLASEWIARWTDNVRGN